VFNQGEFVRGKAVEGVEKLGQSACRRQRTQNLVASQLGWRKNYEKAALALSLFGIRKPLHLGLSLSLRLSYFLLQLLRFPLVSARTIRDATQNRPWGF